MDQIQAYKCGFCGKVYQRKGSCQNHEKHCYLNPLNNFKCLQVCSHLNKKRVDGVIQFSCAKLGVNMHSHVAERRNLKCVNTTERMKTECDLYEYEYASVFTEDLFN